jgi:hypothetical protein
MKQSYTMGLGEPEPIGKRALFKPSKDDKRGVLENPVPDISGTRRRLRTTIELSAHALAIIQELQNRHRLATGRVLPLWKLVCQAIEQYGESSYKEEVESLR